MEDFRDHTCGECAWGVQSHMKFPDGHCHGEKYILCRRVAFDGLGAEHIEGMGYVKATYPACPAFVPSVKPEPKKCPKCGKPAPRVHDVFTVPLKFQYICPCGHFGRAFCDKAEALADFYKEPADDAS